ncbi:alkaline phosphatase family protein [Paenibacillus silviterrae]|uniref:alkaline phosphatase family protein n=1 Tax=Paenibacillus silviterrae TaxID=3242194 RepID=UPI002542887A|nr:alkaline phosphatase family protein [Paenibacillus chinjuensis]
MNKWIAAMCIFILLFVLAWFIFSKVFYLRSSPKTQALSTQEQQQQLSHSKSANPKARKVILIVVDSLLTSALEEGLKQGILPTFAYLKKQGRYHDNLVSSFPTMSVAIDSTLLTGAYPDQHRVPGLVWYSADRRSMINYGTGPMEIVKAGLSPVLYNSFIHLNGQHLNPSLPTIYEELAQKGFTSGSINGFVYRGAKEHTLHIPPWLSRFTLLPREIRVKGPDFLSFGIFSNPLEGRIDMTDDPFHRVGLNNYFSLETASYLVQHDLLPDFLYVYLPDLDKQLHKKGPSDLRFVQKTDKQLNDFLQQFGSLEKAQEKAVFILIGDSGVTQIDDRKEEAIVPLHELLQQYVLLKPGELPEAHTEMVLAVNETMAYVYKLKESLSYRDIAKAVTADDRIDFIAWKEHDWIHAASSRMADELRYKQGGPYKDPYGQTWTIEGDTKVLDVKLDEQGRSVVYDAYPDGLRRLHAALHSHEGEFLIVTAKPGFELADRSSPHHTGGGAHGALNKTESLIPLFIYGTEEQPKHLRLVDLKEFLLKLTEQNRDLARNKE